jgi:23S rRNA pseudouridine2605 synthase
MRLQKALSAAGVASRRKAEVLIAQGRVLVNGKRATLGMKVTPEDAILVDSHPVMRDVAHVSYALYKPVGVLSSVGDDRGRPTVMELVPPAKGLHPVGRLDLDSAGLLIMTNDGDLTMRLSHPRYQHEKTYRVTCKQGRVPVGVLRQLERGIDLDDGPAKAKHARPAGKGCVLVLTEGRNRQVRRMMAALGFDVTELLRTHIDKLALGNLRPGECRELNRADFIKLGYK